MAEIDIKTIVPKADSPFLAEPRMEVGHDSKQRKLMLGSLCLLLVALGIALWHERDFWFPDTQEADTEEPAETSPAPKVAPSQPAVAAAKTNRPVKPKHQVPTASAPVAPAPAPPVAASAARTVLPPLEVEVIAGDTHRTVLPGSSSVRVDLQPGSPPQPVTDAGFGSAKTAAGADTKTAATGDAKPAATGDAKTAASVTSNAAEHVQMSADASEIIAHPVRPNYPLLARQMKVQGSVILQALISKDGIIQNLRVVSGPNILASAAEDAVRQWHFKPHFQGAEAVETEAKITVNFTISTN